LRLPGVCNGNWETTVWAHSNSHEGGKAKGKKLARVDHIGAYACYACHMVLDGQAKRPDGMTREFVLTRFAAAMRESEEKLRRKGLWPTDEFLASKPVTAHKPITKKVMPLAARTIEKKVTPVEQRSREPVGAGRGFSRGNTLRTPIVSSSDDKEKPKLKSANRWPKRKLMSASRLQSRPFGSR
jgi:hypothetical protein